MEEKKKVPILNIIILILLVVSLGINVFISIMLIKDDKKSDTNESVEAIADVEEITYSSDEMANLMDAAIQKGYENGYNDLKSLLKANLTENNSANLALREIFTDHIVYVHKGEYVFKEINEELPLNTLNKDGFIARNSDSSEYTMEYIEDDFEAYKGIDVSKFQGEIDWEKVALSGVAFSFVRVGYRGYETGKLVEDETARYNIEKSLENGIMTGVYFYTQAITVEEAIEEAQFVIDIVKDYDINYPIAFDLEVVNDDAARTHELTTEDRIAIVKAFCDTIKEAGYTPMLYGNLATMFSLVEYEEVLDYEKWYAYYDTELYFPYDLAVWQYSCTGIVDGIEGECDLNLAFKNLKTK